MPELNFIISQNDMSRLFALKDLEGRHNLNGNEYAAELLQRELRRLFPPVPQYNVDGELTNADAYEG